MRRDVTGTTASTAGTNLNSRFRFDGWTLGRAAGRLVFKSVSRRCFNDKSTRTNSAVDFNTLRFVNHFTHSASTAFIFVVPLSFVVVRSCRNTYSVETERRIGDFRISAPATATHTMATAREDAFCVEQVFNIAAFLPDCP